MPGATALNETIGRFIHSDRTSAARGLCGGQRNLKSAASVFQAGLDRYVILDGFDEGLPLGSIRVGDVTTVKQSDNGLGHIAQASSRIAWPMPHRTVRCPIFGDPQTVEAVAR